jgi:L-cysteate sulfo-lyase
VTSALELVEQANVTGLDIDLVVTATGSTGTQAGLVAGLDGCRSGIPVLGICVRSPKAVQEDKVFALAQRTADLLGVPGTVERERGLQTRTMLAVAWRADRRNDEALELVAHRRYRARPGVSGKAMAGLIDRAARTVRARRQHRLHAHWRRGRPVRLRTCLRTPARSPDAWRDRRHGAARDG